MQTTVLGTLREEVGTEAVRAMFAENNGRQQSRQLVIVLRWYDQFKK